MVSIFKPIQILSEDKNKEVKIGYDCIKST